MKQQADSLKPISAVQAKGSLVEDAAVEDGVRVGSSNRCRAPDGELSAR
ncbi:MAG: hypothetical protein AAGF12_42850 [Myxococcota bacterium]